MMTFYSCGYMIYPRRIAVYLAEKGIAVETVEMDVFAGEQRDPAYLALNPAGSIPALLVEPGFVVNETAAIMEYLEDTVATPNLVGRTPRERARTREFMSMMNDAYVYACNYIVNVSRLFTGMIGQDLNMAHALRARYMLYLEKMEAIASGGDTLQDGLVSYADCALFASAQYFENFYGEELPEQCPKLRRVHAAFATRDSAAPPIYPEGAMKLARERVEGWNGGA